MTVLERELRLELDVAQADEAAARRTLREQIAQLERRLGGAVAAGFPHLVPPVQTARPGRPRVLDLGELERVRDGLADRLRSVEREAQALGARHAAARDLLEGMRLEPGRHHWVRVRAEDLGEPGCQSWRVVPRLGLLGMLMGWWRVKHSSGCPLATAGAAETAGAPGQEGFPRGPLGAGTVGRLSSGQEERDGPHRDVDPRATHAAAIRAGVDRALPGLPGPADHLAVGWARDVRRQRLQRP